MRWTPTVHHVFEQRERSAFLWLPKTINGETRWLERAAWLEEYRASWHEVFWEPLSWIEPVRRFRVYPDGSVEQVKLWP